MLCTVHPEHEMPELVSPSVPKDGESAQEKPEAAPVAAVEEAPASRAVVGIIYPPPEVRSIHVTVTTCVVLYS